MAFHFQEGEMLLINKPLEWTSFDVVNSLRYFIRKVYGLKKIKVGHAGTLDPMASGLLIICTGKMTKEINRFQGMDKVYAGRMYIGATTPSYDKETKPDRRFDIKDLNLEKLIVSGRNRPGSATLFCYQGQRKTCLSFCQGKGKGRIEIAKSNDLPI